MIVLLVAVAASAANGAVRQHTQTRSTTRAETFDLHHGHTTTGSSGVWPPPKFMALGGEPLALAPGFRAVVVTAGSVTSGDLDSASARLGRAVERFSRLVTPTAAAAAALLVPAPPPPSPPLQPTPQQQQQLTRLEIHVADMSEHLGITTNYSYTLDISSSSSSTASASKPTATVAAHSIFGAMYALETFAQLVDVRRGVLRFSSVKVTDSPAHSWRGLMVDTGRRFAPTSLLENIIDTMAAVKLNVLHLHLSDFCRFGVESLLFPNLTAGLVAGTPNAGFYSQAEIKQLIAYAGDRGVRIVPEIEMPGHALGFSPISSVGGLEFCSTCAYGPTGNGSHMTCRPSQLWGTPGTARVLKAVLGEMAALFTDEVFHVGADETFVKAGPTERCGPNSTAFLEAQMVDAVTRDFKKVPAGWEQVLFETGAVRVKPSMRLLSILTLYGP
jgi:hypothetical protein